ncbi:Mo-dependent nitrogenase C-terminal domain-containing protein [cf. Phormidesmis sp. LEGE 11477]|uniref:Mo-dependent nitrogenase C-terminal domain-containing protein n=1 Tax=cf. Phormidesmis sp. LEGE 11477 TaxID=1828680 RepID=UPI0018816257|nr:Mo-dependent nitrogenase C-terminal domain-containing protein [cf. Phormidesmis sp. LEGE 11477]MBE9059816.1 hypothetical protein [cf. Phormidesmis sp. LEGE 11477]
MSFLPSPFKPSTLLVHPLAPVRTWLNALEVHNVRLAQWVCRLVPNTCSSGHDLILLGHCLHVPSLCEVNPLADELVDLRFRAADFLYEQGV